MHYGEKGSMACAVLYLLLPQWLCHISGVSCIYHKQTKNPVFAQTEIHVSFQDCSPSVLPCVCVCVCVCVQSTAGRAQNTPIGAALGQSLSGMGVMWAKMCRCEPIGSPLPRLSTSWCSTSIHPPACSCTPCCWPCGWAHAPPPTATSSGGLAATMWRDGALGHCKTSSSSD